MEERVDKLIRAIYKRWKAGQPGIQEAHPDEETLACFLDNRLSREESEGIKAHLIACDSCAELIAIQLRLKTVEPKKVPEELLNRVKGLVKAEDKISLLEIFLRLKEKTLEIINTTGDVLLGQELVPAPILRSRQIKDFKDEVTILKDFKDIRVEVKIENRQGEAFDVKIMVKEKDTQRIIKDLRVTLLKDEVELESYLTTSGKVIFEHILLGKYIIEISTIEDKIASILLDIKT